jgi:protein-tyrosine phosphatase
MHEAKVKHYVTEELPKYEQLKATGKVSKEDSKPPRHPDDKLNRQEKQVLADREFVMKNKRCIVVHCTHGYNRSGFMIVHFLMRMHPLMHVADCIRKCDPLGSGIISPKSMDSRSCLARREEVSQICCDVPFRINRQ